MSGYQPQSRASGQSQPYTYQSAPPQYQQMQPYYPQIQQTQSSQRQCPPTDQRYNLPQRPAAPTPNQYSRFPSQVDASRGYSQQSRRPSGPPSAPSPGSNSSSPKSSSSSSQGSEKGVFPCLLCGAAPARLADLQRHYDRVHVERPTLYPCPVPGCNRGGDNGLPRKDKLTDHLRDKHRIDIPKMQRKASS